MTNSKIKIIKQLSSHKEDMLQRKFPRVTEYFGRALSIEDFQKVAELGKGTYGFVSLYRHIDTGKEYAIKRIQLAKEGKKVNSREEIELLTRKQLQVLYKIDSEHIIKLIDHFEDREAVYIITQFIQGSNLYDLSLKHSRHLPVDIIADIIYQICLGLEELHSNHIIHRDIKLQNVMYNDGVVKIVDLGCSNFYGESISRHTTIGTKFYWSPEIISQEEQNDRLDVWCVGVMLYELLFLEQPFNGQDIQKKIRKCEYAFPEAIKPEPELEDLFRKIFTHKNNRLKAAEVRKHPWIRRHKKTRDTVNARFEDFFSQDERAKYHEMLKRQYAQNLRYLQQIKPRTDKLESLLKEARRQLRKK